MTTRSWILSKFVTIYPLHTSGEFQVFLSYSCQHLNSELSKILSRFLQYLIGTQHDMKWTYVLSHIHGDNPQICGWLFGKCVHFEWLVTPCGRGDSLDLGGQSEASIRAWWPMRGRVSGLCSVYLCDDLETESLGPGITVSLSPGPGLSQSANQKWLRRGSADYICIIQWSKSEFWQFVGFDSWLLTSLLCTQSFQPAPCDKSIPAREMPILRSCVWLFWEFYKSITSI